MKSLFKVYTIKRVEDKLFAKIDQLIDLNDQKNLLAEKINVIESNNKIDKVQQENCQHKQPPKYNIREIYKFIKLDKQIRHIDQEIIELQIKLAKVKFSMEFGIKDTGISMNDHNSQDELAIIPNGEKFYDI